MDEPACCDIAEGAYRDVTKYLLGEDAVLYVAREAGRPRLQSARAGRLRRDIATRGRLGTTAAIAARVPPTFLNRF